MKNAYLNIFSIIIFILFNFIYLFLKKKEEERKEQISIQIVIFFNDFYMNAFVFVDIFFFEKSVCDCARFMYLSH